MAQISYRRHRFPPTIIQHAVWLYLRFTLSYRDVAAVHNTSTSNAISSPARRCGYSAPRRRTNGEMRSQPREHASGVGARFCSPQVKLTVPATSSWAITSKQSSCYMRHGHDETGSMLPKRRVAMAARPSRIRSFKFHAGQTGAGCLIIGRNR